MKVYTAKRKVLREIQSKLAELGDFKYFDILVFENKIDFYPKKPTSMEELEQALKDCDKVYRFDRVETILHGAIAYDIIINE